MNKRVLLIIVGIIAVVLGFILSKMAMGGNQQIFYIGLIIGLILIILGIFLKK